MSGRRRTTLYGAIAVLISAVAASSAAARVRVSAMVTDVVDGQRLNARAADGTAVGVRLIGVDTPTGRECGGSRARTQLARLVRGRAVTLVSDPVQGPTDDEGRFLLYVDRGDGIDAGEQLLLTGSAVVDDDAGGFERESDYLAAQREARADRAGVWDSCGGDAHRTIAEERRIRRRSAEAFVRRYYRNLTRNRFATAWRMLGPRVRRRNGSFRRWKAGHRRSLSTSVRSARARLSGSRAVVTVSLLSRDRDACSRRIVRQRFRGRWLLNASGGSWVGAKLRIRKTAGGKVRLSRSECAPKRRRGSRGGGGGNAPPPRDCQGYSPCLPPGPDVDCRGGSGNGPRYVSGPVQVNGSDPYDLDRDRDGTGWDT